MAFGFQRTLDEWAIRKGRSAVLADCGMGKTLMQLVWAQNCVIETNKPTLICTPIAVGYQTVKEAEKLGLKSAISRDGTAVSPLTITNYEKLHLFKSSEFSAICGDESSILKSDDGATKAEFEEFSRQIPYRSLWTATAAPNDYFELGTSSEVLGDLGFRDMITMFFKQETRKDHLGWGRTKYRFREHGKKAFWRWVCSWARACRKPSDLGFSDDGFSLPELIVKQEVITRSQRQKGRLFDVPAVGLHEQRIERRETINDRCSRVAELVSGHDCSVVFCHLNEEGDAIEKMIPGSVQISGKDSDDSKEKKLLGFSDGSIKRLITKPKIGCWGMNWQHCNHLVSFPSHSYEQYYQMVRRLWRFGQKREVFIDIVSTEGEEDILKNLQRKSEQAEEMFTSLVAEMNNSQRIGNDDLFPMTEEVPQWLSAIN